MKSRTLGIALCAGCAALTLSSAALADEAQDILAKVDKAMSRSKDQQSTLTMVLEDSDGKTKERQMSLKQKGTKLKMIKFTSPAEVKGVGFLTLSDDEMYLYMPEFGKVRRIASHLKNDTFMGTDFSYSDMGSTSYTDKYDGKLLKKEKGKATLELTPKKGKDIPYSKLVLTVDLERSLPERAEFFDQAGKPWKVMEYSQVEEIDGHWVPRTITMHDLKKKHATRTEMSDIKFDTGLKDREFSQRMLKRAR